MTDGQLVIEPLANEGDDMSNDLRDARTAHLVTHQARYDRMLGPFGDAMLAAARLRRGERVVDVGCGTGATTVAAARAVGGTGRVMAIDLDESLVRHAADRCAGAGLANVDAVCGDAASYPYAAGGADVVISRFATMLFADPVAAHANLRRALGPDGRLCAVVWQAVERNLWHALPMAAVFAHVERGPQLHDSPEPAGPFAFASPTRVERILFDAGFVDIELEALHDDLWVASDSDDAIAFFDDDAGSALRSAYGVDTVLRIYDDLRRDLEPYATRDGIRLRAAAWLVTARARSRW